MHKRRCFISQEEPRHLPAPWGLPVGHKDSKDWSSCLAYNLLTYCVHNKWVLTITSWGSFCQNQILNPLKTWWKLLGCFSGILPCLSVYEKRGTERYMERNSGKWISYSLLITGKHIFSFSNIKLANTCLKRKKLLFILNCNCKVKSSLNLQKIVFTRENAIKNWARRNVLTLLCNYN